MPLSLALQGQYDPSSGELQGGSWGPNQPEVVVSNDGGLMGIANDIGVAINDLTGEDVRGHPTVTVIPPPTPTLSARAENMLENPLVLVGLAVAAIYVIHKYA